MRAPTGRGRPIAGASRIRSTWPGAQRRGVGRALLDRLVAEAERRGFRQMIAVIGDSAQTPSIELHRAAGFRLIGNVENVGYKFDRWLDTVLMQRALGPGAMTKP